MYYYSLMTSPNFEVVRTTARFDESSLATLQRKVANAAHIPSLAADDEAFQQRVLRHHGTIVVLGDYMMSVTVQLGDEHPMFVRYNERPDYRLCSVNLRTGKAIISGYPLYESDDTPAGYGGVVAMIVDSSLAEQPVEAHISPPGSDYRPTLALLPALRHLASV